MISQIISLSIFILLISWLYCLFNHKKLFFLALLLGVLYSLLTASLYALLPSLYFPLYISIVEELSKFFLYIILFKIYQQPQKERLLVILIMALVFATVENSFYLLNQHHLILIRAITTLPMHLITSCFIALYPYGVIAAIAIHTLYNTLVRLNNGLSLLIIPLLIGLTLFLAVKIKQRFQPSQPQGFTINWK